VLLSILAGLLSGAAPAGADWAACSPFWVANYRPTSLWSGTDAAAISFRALPRFTPLLALGQAGDRLLVLDAAAEGTAYVDAGDVGPVGPPYPAVAFLAPDGGVRLVKVEVADTPERWEHGLMGRTSLPPDSGMLFVFPEPGTVGFWMKDTPLPLSIAFIDASGAVLSVQDMQPFSTDVHSPPAPYRYALEVSQGYFAAHDIPPGARAAITLPSATSRQGAP
jgi:uncharacterized membrane protein (UPF0127 family)